MNRPVRVNRPVKVNRPVGGNRAIGVNRPVGAGRRGSPASGGRRAPGAATGAGAGRSVLDPAAIREWSERVAAERRRLARRTRSRPVDRVLLIGPRAVAAFRREASERSPVTAVAVLGVRAAGRGGRVTRRLTGRGWRTAHQAVGRLSSRLGRPPATAVAAVTPGGSVTPAGSAVVTGPDTAAAITVAAVGSSVPSRHRLFVDALPLSTERMSGVGHSLAGLVAALAADPAVTRRYRIILLTTRIGLARLRERDLGPVEYRALPLPGRVLRALPRLPFLPPVDLLLGRGTYLFGNYYALPLARSTSVVMVYDLGYLHQPTAVPPVFGAMLARWLPRWCARATRVATVSQATADDLTASLGVPPDRILVARPGVDPEVFRPRSAAEIDAVRRRYDLPERYLLHLGNIEPRKNLVRLIAAYRNLPAELRADTALLLVGGGWAQQETLAAVAAARAAGDDVRRLSHYVVDADLPAVISGAVALAHVAVLEGFGFPPLQAMACGVPVVVADNSSLPEVVGPAGIYVQADDVASITKGLSSVLTDSGRVAGLVRAGRDRAAQFSWAAGAAPLVRWLVESAGPDRIDPTDRIAPTDRIDPGDLTARIGPAVGRDR